MKTKFKGILTLLLALFVQVTFAQEKTVSGTVSEASGPLPGVSVTVKGTTSGTETDFNGKYSIKTKSGDVLVFRYLGFKASEKTVGSSNTINVTMVEDANELEEIVVTALGIKREKASLGFSQQTVDSKNLVRTREADIATALAGKVAGVQFQGSPGSGFGNSDIRIRGNSGVAYIVDGIRVNASVDVNTEDVESISILKGAAATALYGPTAGNGVVVITSKKAKSGQSSITINHSTSFDQLYLLPDYQDEYGGGYNQASDNPDAFTTFNYSPASHPSSWAAYQGQLLPQYDADESWGPKLDGRQVRHWDSWIPGDEEFGKTRGWSPNPDNVRDYFQTGVTNNTSVTFAKGGEDYSVRSNITNIDKETIYLNSKRKQVNASINAEFNINEKLKAYAFVNFQDRRTNNSPENGYSTVISNFNQWWQRQLDMDRVMKYRRNGQIVSWNLGGPTNPKPAYWDSPYFQVYENLSVQNKNALYGKLGLAYTLNENINASVEIRKSLNSYESNNRIAFGGLNPPDYSEEESIDVYDELFGVINYDKDITEDIDIQATLGFEINDSNYKRIRGSAVGGLTTVDFYSLATSVDRPSLTSYKERTKRKSTFGKASLGWKNMLYLDGSVRLDWQSTANPDANRVETYGGSASFIFSRLLPQNDILSFGKVRASLAEAPSFPDAYDNNITYGTGTPYGSFGGQTLSDVYPNPDLIGGKKSEMELGAEFKFFKSRVGLDMTYFEKTNDKLPASVSLDGSTGFTSTTSNEGQQAYKGLEIALYANPVRTETINWDFNVNFATITRWVNQIAPGIDSNRLGGAWGLSLLAKRGEEYGSLYGRAYRRDDQGRKILSSAGAPRYDTNQYLGNFLPDFTGGFSNNITIGNFNLGFDLDFQSGGKIYSVSTMFAAQSGLSLRTAENNKLGNEKRDPLTSSTGNPVQNYRINADNVGADSGGVYIEGVDETTGDPVAYYVNPYRYYKSLNYIAEEWLYDNTYVKLRTMRVDYNLPKNILEKTPFKAANFGVYANNLWMIYNSVPNTDNSEINNGYLEQGHNPNVRTFGFNVKLTF